MLHQIKAQQFFTNLDSYQQCWVQKKLAEFKDFSRPLSDFPVFFKADLIFKDFSSKPSKFKYFSSLSEPWFTLNFPLLYHIFILNFPLLYHIQYLPKTFHYFDNIF